MKKWIAVLAAIVLLSGGAFSATISLNPKSQTTNTTCTLSVGVADLVGIKGIDIVLSWDRGVMSCSGARLVPGAPPGFAPFLERIDNAAGTLEVVLLKQSPGGFTGSAEPFLAVIFEALASGTTLVIVQKSSEALDPLLVDETGLAVAAAVDTATVIVSWGVPPSAITVTKLHQNYPNPFNPSTTIRFDVPSSSPVRLRVYDVNGGLVRRLIDGERYERGSWVRDWDGRNSGGVLVPSGVYVCVLEASGERSSMKLVVLR